MEKNNIESRTNRTMNLRNLRNNKRICDMAVRTEYLRHNTTGDRDADFRAFLDAFLVRGSYKLIPMGHLVFVDGSEADFCIEKVETETIFDYYPEYRFLYARNLTIRNCRIGSLEGLPSEVFGDLIFEDCSKKFSLRDKELNLPMVVHGDISITDCPYLHASDFKKPTIVHGKIYDSVTDGFVDADCPFTEGQQLILDYASDLGDDLFSADEWNDLEQFFRDQF